MKISFGKKLEKNFDHLISRLKKKVSHDQINQNLVLYFVFSFIFQSYLLGIRSRMIPFPLFGSNTTMRTSPILIILLFIRCSLSFMEYYLLLVLGD